MSRVEKQISATHGPPKSSDGLCAYHARKQTLQLCCPKYPLIWINHQSGYVVSQCGKAVAGFAAHVEKAVQGSCQAHFLTQSAQPGMGVKENTAIYPLFSANLEVSIYMYHFEPFTILQKLPWPLAWRVWPPGFCIDCFVVVRKSILGSCSIGAIILELYMIPKSTKEYTYMYTPYCQTCICLLAHWEGVRRVNKSARSRVSHLHFLVWN